ncbi:MAG: FAD-dependent oxidoreductase [Saprospiraceae bacterium]
MTVDFIIIGGGIFGVYTALYLTQQGQSGILLEKEPRLLSRASLVNQARLHGGYHYPRSVATAQLSHEHQSRFIRDHRDFIHASFDQFYAIDRFGSLTDGLQFRRFCDYIGAPLEEVVVENPFHAQRIANLYKTTEYSFDPVLLGNHYSEKISQNADIQLFTNTEIKQVEKNGENWEIDFLDKNKKVVQCKTPLVVNATYAASNAIHKLFDVPTIDLQYEIAEMVLLSVPQFANQGLTIMDGQFGSLMPYGLTGLHSLSSVAYTHHEVSKQELPTFNCQKAHQSCSPNLLAHCNHCHLRPSSNFNKMRSQLQQYFTEAVQFDFYQSLFTIKSKLRANSIDDGRPTEIRKLASAPDFYCVFAGKVQSIYEIEKVF